MPRKPNYQYEKRQKELERAARKEEKRQRRQERTTTEGEEGAPAPDGADVGDDAGAPTSS